MLVLFLLTTGSRVKVLAGSEWETLLPPENFTREGTTAISMSIILSNMLNMRGESPSPCHTPVLIFGYFFHEFALEIVLVDVSSMISRVLMSSLSSLNVIDRDLWLIQSNAFLKSTYVVLSRYKHYNERGNLDRCLLHYHPRTDLNDIWQRERL